MTEDGASGAMRIEEVRSALSVLPRVSLAALPTPLDACRRVTAELGGQKLYIKRDDLTGLAFGGNKVRQHEYVLGDALDQGADCFVQGSASQSNHSRQLAAAGAKLGVETFLLPKSDAMSSPIQGNYLIDHVLGAHIIPIEPGQSTVEAKAALVEQLRTDGRRPYVTGMGAERALILAAVAYVGAVLEIIEELPPGPGLDYLYTASQGSTQAGLLLGCELLGLTGTKVVGIAPMTSRHEAYIHPAGVLEMVHSAAGMLGFESQLTAADIHLDESYVGDNYGVPSASGLEAIAFLGRTEGILLDPVYSGKAFAGLLDHLRTGVIPDSATVVFLHTGGLPALFAYHEVVAQAMQPQDGASQPTAPKQ